MEGDRLVTVTPWRRTSSGSAAVAACTRLLTLMVAWSGLVPTAKDTEMVIAPLPALTEFMYSMPSTPLICWLAPGYTAETMTCGGTISGYCAMGSVRMAMNPASMITMEITHAKMGRCMKKRDIIAESC